VGSEDCQRDQRQGCVRVSDQPSWGRRIDRITSIVGFDRFRPTLVGSEAENYYQDNQVIDWFQTNPRGVGGTSRMISLEARARFRPTLVGSEDGRHALLRGGVASFRPTLVGSEGRVLRRRQFARHRFRPTLVGSEALDKLASVGTPLVSDQPSWGRRGYLIGGKLKTLRFRPTLVGSEGDNRHRSRQRSVFQTNPRGVGGLDVRLVMVSWIVSDQPSWGRRSNPHM